MKNLLCHEKLSSHLKAKIKWSVNLNENKLSSASICGVTSSFFCHLELHYVSIFSDLSNRLSFYLHHFASDGVWTGLQTAILAQQTTHIHRMQEHLHTILSCRVQRTGKEDKKIIYISVLVMERWGRKTSENQVEQDRPASWDTVLLPQLKLYCASIHKMSLGLSLHVVVEMKSGCIVVFPSKWQFKNQPRKLI